jgi:hypothetical protein
MSMCVSIDDYAKFLIGVMRGEGMTPSLSRDRWRVQSSVAGAAEWHCEPTSSVTCPDSYGFGLGYPVFDYDAAKLIWTSGNDAGENALAYFTSSAPGDAVIVGNGFIVISDIIDLVDPKQKLGAYFRRLIKRQSEAKS